MFSEISGIKSNILNIICGPKLIFMWSADIVYRYLFDEVDQVQFNFELRINIQRNNFIESHARNPF
jgi:hypothetical protein